MRDLRTLLDQAKSKMPIPALWRIIKPGDAPPDIGACHSPFRPDKSKSFSIFAGGQRWKDHGTGDGGDAVDFIMRAENCEKPAAIHHLLELAGIRERSLSAAVFTRARARRDPEKGRIEASDCISNSAVYDTRFPDVSCLHRPTNDEINEISRLRHLDPAAVGRAADWCILRTGTMYGHRVWALVDGPPGEPKRIAEIRRMDGQRIITRDNPEGIKGKTLPGSKKDWPVGASLLAHPRAASHGVSLVEGMPDFLAAVHFAWQADRFDLYPVAVLGRSVTTLHPAAIALLAGRRIRAYPHADPDGGGMAAMQRWAAQFPGATVDAFTFTGLLRSDGKPVNDLNDAAVIRPDEQHLLGELLP